MAQPLPIAGWYPDPEFPSYDRWWDGTTWSDNRRTASVAAVPVAAPAVVYMPASAYMPAPAYAPAPVVRNNLALIGFILSMTGVVVPVVLNSLAGGIVSAIGLRRSKKLAAIGVFSTGRGLSIAGILIGFIWAGLCLLFIAAWIVFFLWILTTANNVPYSGSPAI
jgi:hypothetical protein